MEGTALFCGSSVFSVSIAAQQRKRGSLEQSTQVAFQVTLYWSIWCRWGIGQYLYSQGDWRGTILPPKENI